MVERPRVYTCGHCGFRFTYRPPDDDVIRRAYASSETDVWPDDPRNTKRRGYAQRVSIITKHAPARSVLDIGCYTGEYLDQFPMEWEKFGIEPSQRAARAASARGIQVIGTDVFESELPANRYGAVSMLNIIEHVKDPKLLIERAVRLLVERGILLVETGDTASVYSRFMGEFWAYYHIPEHISFLSRKLLVETMRKCGLEIVLAKSNCSYKKSAGLKSWAYQQHTLARAAIDSIRWRIHRRLGGSVEDPKRVIWTVYKDHMLVVGRKTPNSQSAK